MTLNEMITTEEFLDQPVCIKTATGIEYRYINPLKRFLQMQYLKVSPLGSLYVLSQKDKEFLEHYALVELGLPPANKIKVGTPHFPYKPYLKKSLGN